MKSLVALLSALFLAACASSGVRVTDAQMSQFVEGQTTQQEVIAALGNPTTSMRNSDGTTMMIYSYFEARTRPTTFIPIVGAFAGGADTRSSSAVMTFDQSGLLQNYSTTAGETGTATGIAVDGGDPITDQPRKLD